MMNCALPIQPRERNALRARDGNNGHVPELSVERYQIREVQPAVQSSEMKSILSSEERKMQIVRMKMDEVKSIGTVQYLRDHGVVKSQGIMVLATQSQCFIRT